MGEAADKQANYIIVTDDDPYDENQWAIVNDIKAGIEREESDNFWRIPNRREAIKLALTLAKEGDILMGKREIWGIVEILGLFKEFSGQI